MQDEETVIATTDWPNQLLAVSGAVLLTVPLWIRTPNPRLWIAEGTLFPPLGVLILAGVLLLALALVSGLGLAWIGVAHRGREIVVRDGRLVRNGLRGAALDLAALASAEGEGALWMQRLTLVRRDGSRVRWNTRRMRPEARAIATRIDALLAESRSGSKKS